MRPGACGRRASRQRRAVPYLCRYGERPASGGANLPEDPAALEAIIVARRRHLSDTVDELVVRTPPKEIARRSAADAKERAVGLVSNDDGQLRYERMVPRPRPSCSSSCSWSCGAGAASGVSLRR